MPDCLASSPSWEEEPAVALLRRPLSAAFFDRASASAPSACRSRPMLEDWPSSLTTPLSDPTILRPRHRLTLSAWNHTPPLRTHRDRHPLRSRKALRKQNPN